MSAKSSTCTADRLLASIVTTIMIDIRCILQLYGSSLDAVWVFLELLCKIRVCIFKYAWNYCTIPIGRSNVLQYGNQYNYWLQQPITPNIKITEIKVNLFMLPQLASTACIDCGNHVYYYYCYYYFIPLVLQVFLDHLHLPQPMHRCLPTSTLSLH